MKENSYLKRLKLLEALFLKKLKQCEDSLDYYKFDREVDVSKFKIGKISAMKELEILRSLFPELENGE